MSDIDRTIGNPTWRVGYDICSTKGSEASSAKIVYLRVPTRRDFRRNFSQVAFPTFTLPGGKSPHRSKQAHASLKRSHHLQVRNDAARSTTRSEHKLSSEYPICFFKLARHFTHYDDEDDVVVASAARHSASQPTPLAAQAPPPSFEVTPYKSRRRHLNYYRPGFVACPFRPASYSLKLAADFAKWRCPGLRLQSYSVCNSARSIQLEENLRCPIYCATTS